MKTRGTIFSCNIPEFQTMVILIYNNFKNISRARDTSYENASQESCVATALLEVPEPAPVAWMWRPHLGSPGFSCSCFLPLKRGTTQVAKQTMQCTSPPDLTMRPPEGLRPPREGTELAGGFQSKKPFKRNRK